MHLEATQPVSALCAPPNIERRFELPTLVVAVAVHGGFLVLTLFFRELPILLWAPLGSLLLAWYGSLQQSGDSPPSYRAPGARCVVRRRLRGWYSRAGTGK
jgi:hypothetical protein